MRKLLVLVVLLAMVLPLSASAATPVTYTSGFQLQNLTATDASIAIDFYNPDGTQPANSSISDTIPANSSKTYYPLNTVPDGFNGSAVVSSSQQVAAITNVLGNGGQRGAAYGGFSAGATTVSLPLVMKNNYGIDTWFNVQNTGNADATVNVAYLPGTCTDTATIKPGASHTFDQAQTACLGTTRFVGAATVTANQPVVAVVMQVSTTSLLAYAGFNSSSQAPVFPQVSSNYYNSGTGIQVQNTGGADTNVTLSYTPSAGFPGAACTETHPVPAGQSVTFGWPQLPATCGQKSGTGVTDTTNGGFVGSAKVTANTASAPLAAIVNVVTRGAAAGDAYNAVDPAAATSKVSMPIMMDRNYGLFTGFAVANVGTQATNVNCTFSGTGVTASATNLAPGAALTSVQLNAIADKYVGSGTCTATGGDAKIAGIVNQTQLNMPAANDVLLMYGAIPF